MDFEKLANALVPDTDLLPIEEYDKIYPPRALEKGAEVTRIAPSPTGFMHLGNLYVALANERIAHQSGGVFYLRIEDTDEKRKVEGAVEVVHKSLKYFGVNFDEGADKCGDYGPYYQRQRAKIYQIGRACLSLLLYGRGAGKNARISDGKQTASRLLRRIRALQKSHGRGDLRKSAAGQTVRHSS